MYLARPLSKVRNFVLHEISFTRRIELLMDVSTLKRMVNVHETNIFCLVNFYSSRSNFYPSILRELILLIGWWYFMIYAIYIIIQIVLCITYMQTDFMQTFALFCWFDLMTPSVNFHQVFLHQFSMLFIF